MFHYSTPRISARASNGVAFFLTSLPTVLLIIASLIAVRDRPTTVVAVTPSTSPVVATLAPRSAMTLAAAPARPADLTCLAKAVYYEARGESAEGQAAVAQVVLNRTRRPTYPKSVCAVVYQGVGAGGCQFSFVCNGAMRRPLEPVAWTRARGVAARALGGHVMLAVGQAVSFHVAPLGGGRIGEIARIGSHVFFDGARRAPSRRARPVEQMAEARSADSAGVDAGAVATGGV